MNRIGFFLQVAGTNDRSLLIRRTDCRPFDMGRPINAKKLPAFCQELLASFVMVVRGL
jgi:hypothetical protein